MCCVLSAVKAQLAVSNKRSGNAGERLHLQLSAASIASETCSARSIADPVERAA